MGFNKFIFEGNLKLNVFRYGLITFLKNVYGQLNNKKEYYKNREKSGYHFNWKVEEGTGDLEAGNGKT